MLAMRNELHKALLKLDFQSIEGGLAMRNGLHKDQFQNKPYVFGNIDSNLDNY
jgi:hypothetical protein